MANPNLSQQSQENSGEQGLNSSQNNVQKAKGTMSLRGIVATGITGLLLSVGMPSKPTKYQNEAFAADGTKVEMTLEQRRINKEKAEAAKIELQRVGVDQATIDKIAVLIEKGEQEGVSCYLETGIIPQDLDGIEDLVTAKMSGQKHKTFLEITGSDSMSSANDIAVIKVLCNGDDLPEWSKGYKGVKLTDAEIVTKKAEYAANERTLISAIASIKAKYGEEALDFCYKLYNYHISITPNLKQEKARRLLNYDLLTIAPYKFESIQKKLTGKVTNAITNTSEAMLILGGEKLAGQYITKLVVKYPGNSEKYTFVSYDLKELFSKSDINFNIDQDLLAKITPKLPQQFEEKVESRVRMAITDKETRELDTRNAQLDTRNAQLDTRNAQANELNSIIDGTRIIITELKELPNISNQEQRSLHLQDIKQRTQSLYERAMAANDSDLIGKLGNLLKRINSIS